MFKFYRRNISHMNCKSSIFLVITSLCISSTRILPCSARPNQDISDIRNENTTESDIDDVAKALDDLPQLSPETKKHIQDMIRENEIRKQGGTIDDLEPGNVDDIEEGNGGEEDNTDYYDDHTGPVISFTELKTTPLPIRPTRPPARPNIDTDLIDDYDPTEDQEDDEIETMPPRTSSTSTTEEPTPRVPIKSTSEDEDSLESNEYTSKPTLLVTSSGWMIKNGSFLLFVPVLMYFFA